MRRSTSVALACAMTLAAATASHAAPGVVWFDGGVDEARTQAAERGQLLLVDCWASWCTYCHKMDREVWTDGDLAKSVGARALPVKVEVDVTRDVGTEFGERYGIDGLPVVLLIDPADGRELARLSGFSTASRIVETIEAAWRTLHPSGDGGADEDEDEGADALLAVAAREKLLGNPDGAVDAARRAIAADPLCADDVADDAALMLSAIERGAGRPDAAREVLARAASACGRADRSAELWSSWADAAVAAGDPAAAGEIYGQKLALFPLDREAMLERAGWAAEHAVEAAALDEALALVRRAADIDPEDPRAPATEARVHAARGDADAALAALERAIAIDPHDRSLRSLRLRWTLRGVSGTAGR